MFENWECVIGFVSPNKWKCNSISCWPLMMILNSDDDDDGRKSEYRDWERVWVCVCVCVLCLDVCCIFPLRATSACILTIQLWHWKTWRVNYKHLYATDIFNDTSLSIYLCTYTHSYNYYTYMCTIYLLSTHNHHILLHSIWMFILTEIWWKSIVTYLSFSNVLIFNYHSIQ